MRKIINDPVHGFITIDDPLIYAIISHAYYQRLRRIKQMALAYLVYPGAVHTRLHHSLGAYHLMGNAIAELRQKGIAISADEEQAARIAILLHDIGHGPFSHALEHALVDVHHEDLSLLIMHRLQDSLAEGGRFAANCLEHAIAIFTGAYPKKFLHQLVSSQLDVDRMDYLARDSFFTGVSEGVIGYDRIVKMLTVVNDELVVEEKGIHSIEKFLIARRLMYSQVYLHKTVLSSELMLVKLLTRAKDLVHKGATLFATPALQYFLQKNYSLNDFQTQSTCLYHFLQLDDFDIVSALKVWVMHEDLILSDLSRRLLDRDLFKVRFYKTEESGQVEIWRQQVQADFSLDDESMAYYFMQSETSSSTYDAHIESIRILLKNGDIIDITEAENTLIREGLLVPVKKPYICFLRK
jgi:HD superfamily phosphohydrolase